MDRPRLFIGSSSEARDKHVTEALRSFLEGAADVQVWHDSVFHLGQGTLDGLLAKVETFDFAAMIFTPDDLAQSRGDTRMVPRDNVVFELGLFMGRLGKERTIFIVAEEDEQTAKIPTDLLGITFAKYSVGKQQQLKDAIAPVAARIQQEMKRLGVIRYRDTADNLRLAFEARLRSAFGASRSIADDPFLAIFRDEIAADIGRWSHIAGTWPDRRIEVTWEQPSLIINAIKVAKSEIFATSVPAFSRVWADDERATHILLAQQQNQHARSQRIFVFNKREDITPDDIRVMKQHQAYNIDVRIYLDQPVKEVDFPPELRNDWIMIDEGAAIGNTKRLDASGVAAEWYFHHEIQTIHFKTLRNRLRQFSKPLSEFS